jgi:hypothetical protein
MTRVSRHSIELTYLTVGADVVQELDSAVALMVVRLTRCRSCPQLPGKAAIVLVAC